MNTRLGNDIIIPGSGSVVSRLMHHGLIDEYGLLVSPILFGNGGPLIGGLSQRSTADLLEVRKYLSGNVVLRYLLAK